MRFEILAQKLDPKLKLIARKLDGRSAAFSDEDLYQEALLDLWQKCQQGQAVDKTDSYLVQGAFFKMKNYIRTARKTADRLTFSLNNLPAAEGGSQENPFAFNEEKNFEKIENQADLDIITRTLTRREKQVFDLTCDGLTTREIGGYLGISHVMVGKIVKKIRIKCHVIPAPREIYTE